ncbi:MAG: DUF86 domain-containing protein [Muribaculaceae bacterium]|nr:DUF86 domain-containing protein [Muribaculaceae bacterium]
MDERIKKYLADIQYAIEEIESYISQRPKQYNVFLNDSMFRSAIERKISIIGEATNRILKIDPDISISNSRKIVNTRNYVIHAYDTLSSEMIWGIVVNDLDLLKKEVMTLLSQ